MTEVSARTDLTTPSGPKRRYAELAADANSEDYLLRYAATSFRTWSPFVVATTALGGIVYLTDFAIGASIVMLHGFSSAVLAIAVAAVVIFLTGIPIACACYGVDMDAQRRAGFGYFGSTLTTPIVLFGMRALAKL